LLMGKWWGHKGVSLESVKEKIARGKARLCVALLRKWQETNYKDEMGVLFKKSHDSCVSIESRVVRRKKTSI